jgi:hypothetical protein
VANSDELLLTPMYCTFSQVGIEVYSVLANRQFTVLSVTYRTARSVPSIGYVHLNSGLIRTVWCDRYIARRVRRRRDAHGSVVYELGAHYAYPRRLAIPSE